MSEMREEVPDAPWAIPASWAWTKMGEVADVFSGGTPSTSDPTNFGGGIPWVTPNDLSGYRSRLIGGGERSITAKGLGESSAVLLPANTVLFSSRAPIGYVAIASQPLATNQGFKNFVLRNGFLPDYVYYYLQRAKPIAVSMASGTTFLEISGKKCAAIPIPIPPLSEQRRIVPKIEELFSDLDVGVAALERVRAKLKRYRASVLNAAVTGKLTEAWRQRNPPAEPADKLLARILDERQRKWEAEQLRRFAEAGKTPPKGWQARLKVPLQASESTPISLPAGWVWVSADACCTNITDGEHITPPRTDEGVYLLSARNVLNGRLALTDVDFVSRHTFRDLCRRLHVKEGDVLLSCSGTVGRSCIVPAGIEFALVRSVAVLKPVLSLGKWLSFALRSLPLQGQINRKKSQTAQANIFQEQIKKLWLPLPPIDEQAEIIAEIERLLSVVEAVEAEVEHGLKRAARLRQAILKRAFEGKLVPQNPADEPAPVLLERLRAAPKAAPVAKGRRQAKNRSRDDVVSVEKD